jgi:hypothetical protein
MTGITKAVVDSFGVAAEQVVVQIVKSSPDSKSRGGIPFSERQRTSWTRMADALPRRHKASLTYHLHQRRLAHALMHSLTRRAPAAGIMWAGKVGGNPNDSNRSMSCSSYPLASWSAWPDEAVMPNGWSAKLIINSLSVFI